MSTTGERARAILH